MVIVTFKNNAVVWHIVGTLNGVKIDELVLADSGVSPATMIKRWLGDAEVSIERIERLGEIEWVIQ